RPVLVRPDRVRRPAAADPAGRAAGLPASRRLRDEPRARLARDERLLVGQGHRRHGHARSFRRLFSGGAAGRARPFSTTPTTLVVARSAGQPCLPRRWTYAQAPALTATSAASTTSGTAASEPSAAPSRRNWMNGCR